MAQRYTLTGIRKLLFERAWSSKSGLLKYVASALTPFLFLLLFRHRLSVVTCRMGEIKSTLWDTLVFSKIAAKLGGRVRLIITGSAPLSPRVKDFLRMYA